MRIQLDHVAFGVPSVADAAAFVAGQLGGTAQEGGPAPGYTGGQWSFARGERPGWEDGPLWPEYDVLGRETLEGSSRHQRQGAQPDGAATQDSSHERCLLVSKRIHGAAGDASIVPRPGPVGESDRPQLYCIAGRAGGGPTLVGRLVLASGRIPRGRAEAPERTVPAGLELGEVRDGLERARARFLGLQSKLPALAASRSTFRHPILGNLRPRQWLRFIQVHHDHHRRIIDDIRRSQRPRA